MPSPTQPPSDSSTSDIIFATVIFLVCLLALALSVRVFRNHHFHRGFAEVMIARVVPARSLEIVSLRR